MITAQDVHDLAVSKGWYDEPQDENAFVERMCNNLHDEISELHEAWRNGTLRQPCDKAEKMSTLCLRPLSCIEEEMADIAIRNMDNAVYLGVDLEAAIQTKHAYNASRPHRHGGKKS